jgi:DNA-binding transcriptional MerR regulator
MFEEVFMIGAFGRLVGLTPSALRFYDDCGVLQPASVDPATGYRLYTVQQERRAVLLRDLREIGLPLSAVRVVLDAPAQEASRILRDHMQSLETKLVPARRTAAAILADLSGAAEVWQVQLGGPELASAIRQVVPAAATNQALPALGCVLLEVDKDEIRLVASDRYRLSVRVLQARSCSAPPGTALVPAPALAELTGWVVRHDQVTVDAGPTGVCVMAGGQTRSLPVVTADFPEYRGVLRALGPAATRTVVDRVALLELLLPGNLPTPVVLDVGHDQLVVSTRDGGTTRTLSAVCSGASLRLGFAPGVLAAALAASVGPDVLLELAAPDRAVVIRSADQGSFTTLAMPTLLTSVDQ